MRKGMTIAIGLAALMSMPAAPAEARNLLGTIVGAPFAILGGIAGAAMGARAAHSRARYRRERASAPQMRQADLVRAQQAAAESAWFGPVYAPHAADAMFAYVFGVPRDDRFWQRGYGDVLQAAFMPPGRQASSVRNRRTKIADSDQAGIAATPPWAALCGSDDANAAEAVGASIRAATQPTPAQMAAFDGLQAALGRAFERVKSVCPAASGATSKDRLNGMIARLTAMGQAALMVRAPLRAYYDGLSVQQKAALDSGAAAAPAPVADNASANANTPETTGTAASPDKNQDKNRDKNTAQMLAECAVPAALPKEQLERMVRAKRMQRADVERLQAMTTQMADLVATTCPTEAAGTAVDRLDAVKSRATVLRYTALNMASVVTHMAANQGGAGDRKGAPAR